MSLMSMFTKSKMAQSFFADDLAERSEERKAIIDRIAELMHKLASLPTKPLADADKAVASAQAQLAEAIAQRNRVLQDSESARQALLKQIKAEEKALKAQTPTVILNAINTLSEAARMKTLLSAKQSTQANQLFEELQALVDCADDQQLLTAVADIEGRIPAIFN